MEFRYKNVYWLWLSAAVILLDQITKQLIVRGLDWYESIPVIPFFNIVHMRNTGAAFSMFAEASPVVFIALGVAVSIGIMWWLRRNPRGQLLVAVALSLILGGALGNVIDRATRGHVVDFIDFYVGNWHFAAFNVADSAISVGAALLILDMVLDSFRQKRGKARAGA
ncbi:signal peptidase II [Algiphilus sp. W345]|uniref:Lipoprotein signal peptidase n=1 Tax=Banduia mediterranea TaxID=3075609 RepID=A0ABU2WGC9_9GAMM|nr:signal peptidase II [Algiphilus sp. W345]MDT0496321.1 signal peptidase II [Algiphilus sp. W345]